MHLDDVEDKLKEAESNYLMMSISKYLNNKDFPLRYPFSNFLASSRSIFEYGFQYLKFIGKSNMYKKWENHRPTVDFFRKKRNLNIHEKPVATHLQILTTIQEKVTVSESLTIVLKNENEKTTTFHGECTNPPEKSPESEVETKFEYFIEGWDGKENLFQACQLYLDEAKEFIKYLKNISP